jgi:hypothetical protein
MRNCGLNSIDIAIRITKNTVDSREVSHSWYPIEGVPGIGLLEASHIRKIVSAN